MSPSRTITLAVLATLFSAGWIYAADQPGVIVFIADDVSWNDYGCYGNTAARTPNIDWLAAHGMRFDQAYLTASSCSPSRSSIITGRYPHNNGKAAELHEPIAGHLPWFPELLRDAGYYTALSGKNHMKSGPRADGTPANRPAAFDLIDGGRQNGNSGGHANWRKITAERPADQPFFFWFASYDAHRAWDADKQWDAAKYGPMHQPENVIVPPFLIDNPATRSDLASYYNEVTRFDFYIGEVLSELRKQDALQNTLIFVLADNGRPFPRAKTRIHDSGMKTALVAHWPQGIRTPGVPTESLASVIDLAPTILEAAGISPAESMQGVSLHSIFSDPTARPRQFAFSEHNWHDYEAHGRGVRGDGLLLIRNSRPELAWQGPADSVRSPSHSSLQKGRDAKRLNSAQNDVFLSPRPLVELYDLKQDPHQLHNLAGIPAFRTRQQALENTLDKWIEATRDSVPKEISHDRFDRETGEAIKGADYRRTTPGEDRGATLTNAPGPR
ncbi:MAG: sulfatase family protein [Planctomycetaceae bacterium]